MANTQPVPQCLLTATNKVGGIKYVSLFIVIAFAVAYGNVQSCSGTSCKATTGSSSGGLAMLQTRAPVRRTDKGVRFVHGVPIYDSKRGKLNALNQSGPAALLQEEEFDWNFFFKTISEEQLAFFCETITSKGASCVPREIGHPDHGGLKWVDVRSTEQHIDELMAENFDFEIEFVEKDELVELIEPPYDADLSLMSTASTSGIPWGLDRIDQEDGLDDSYTSPGSQGEGVHVYVLDTGVRTTHRDFEGRAVPSVESIGNGVVECNPTDISCAGDHHGHGTHCAGTVGGKEYGVAKKASLHSVKVLNPSGYTSWIVGAMDWVVSSGQRPAVISMSLGGPGQSPSYAAAVDSAVGQGVVVVIAAGNSNSDACEFSPAFVPSAITVGSTTVEDTMSSFSNYGTCIDIWGPGSFIKSASDLSDTGTKTMSGTSMACPHVAGAVALLLADNEGLQATEISDIMASKASVNKISAIPTTPPSPNKLLFAVSHLLPTPAPPVTPAPPFLWIVEEGACETDADCIQSPNYPASYGNNHYCKIKTTTPGMVSVKAFDTEGKYDKLTVSGTGYAGSTGPDCVEAKGLMEWTSDNSVVRGGWKICLADLSSECAAAPATPTPPTPPPTSATPTSMPTPAPTPNPSPKPTPEPTPPTSMPTTAAPTPSPPSGWTVTDGDCTQDGASCVQSPNYPSAYSNNGNCTIQITGSVKISASAFETEAQFDKLTVDGIVFSGSLRDGPGGVQATNHVLWTSDYSVTRKGWKLCPDGASDNMPPKPEPAPEPEPEIEPQPQPEPAPEPEPEIEPQPQPEPAPEPEPEPELTTQPTTAPSSPPTHFPTAPRTESPTAAPTTAPTESPTAAPTEDPAQSIFDEFDENGDSQIGITEFKENVLPHLRVEELGQGD